MTIIHCYTCDTRLEESGYILPAELADKNNWIAVKIEGIEGYLCEQCSKWIDSPIRIWRYREPEYFEIKHSQLLNYEELHKSV